MHELKLQRIVFQHLSIDFLLSFQLREYADSPEKMTTEKLFERKISKGRANCHNW